MKIYRSCWAVLLASFWLTLAATSQQASLTAPSPDTVTAAVSSKVGAAAGLPADQLIELLREKPELMIDLKTLAAEQLQAQGVAVQEDSITDEMAGQDRFKCQLASAAGCQ